MTIVCDGNITDGVVRIAFDYRAIAMDRTSTFVTDASHSDAANREVGSSDGNDATTVARGII